MTSKWGVGIIAGVVVGLGATVGLNLATSEAGAQGGFSVTPGQLQTNQKISQAAVRRSNRALNYLAPIRTAQTDNADDGTKGVTPLSQITGSGNGWTSSQIADGAITGPKVADGAVTTAKLGDGAATNSKLAHPTYSAVVTGAGGLDRGDGATGAARLALGQYEVIFGQDVTACTYVVSQGGTTTAVSFGFASAVRRSGNANGVFVRTQDTGAADADRPFHLVVHC